jgi:hypothetical protein
MWYIHTPEYSKQPKEQTVDVQCPASVTAVFFLSHLLSVLLLTWNFKITGIVSDHIVVHLFVSLDVCFYFTFGL